MNQNSIDLTQTEAFAASHGMKVAEANAIAERASRTAVAWATTGPNARRALLVKAAAELEARKDAFLGR